MMLTPSKLFPPMTATAAAAALVLTSFTATPARADKGLLGAIIVLGAACAASKKCRGKSKGKSAKKSGKKTYQGPSDAIAMNTQERILIQQGLAAQGFYSGAIDGAIGPGSRNAIKAYQGAIGAKQTGFLTASQMNALAASAPEFSGLAENDPMIFGADLARDTTQDELRELQAALNEAGFAAGTPDGKFGNNTRNAIAAYKVSNGLAGKPVPTKRLVAFAQGVAFAGVVVDGDAADPESIESVEEDVVLAGQEADFTPPAEDVIAEVDTPEVAPASAETFEILGMRTGMTRSEIEALGIEALGEGTRIDAASFEPNATHPLLDLGHVLVQPSWPEPGSQVFVSYYSSEKPDLGALGLVRVVSVGSEATFEDFEREMLPSLVDVYGERARVPESLTWVGEHDAREMAVSDAAKLQACGRMTLDAAKILSGNAETLGWSAEIAPEMSEAAALPVTAKCGEMMHIDFADQVLQMSAWNSDALANADAADAAEAEAKVLPKIKF